MNLAPHGLLLQVIVWLVNFQHGFRLCGGTEPGYLDFDNLPETNFSCQGKVIGGYYADVETGCQMFHVCTIGQKDEIMDIKFLCLNGTVFDQETRVCERVDEVDCSKSERFYNLNLELYGNNAVTLSLHEETEEDDEPTESIDEQQYSTSTRPTVSSTTTTTPRPTNPPPPTVTASSYHQPGNSYSGYQPSQPSYSTPRTSQSKSLYDDKNSGYHRQYIFHNGEQSNNQATSFQLFSNQGISSTTNVSPQVHQVLQSRYSSTPSTQIHQDSPSTVTTLFHGPSSTLQTLLSSNSNNPSLINPLFHNHGVASTTEHYTVHSNNPRETQEYHHSTEEDTEERRPLEAMQSTNKGKVSKLVISPVPSESSVLSGSEAESRQRQFTATTQQSRIPSGFVSPQTTQSTQTTTTTTKTETTAKTFYPTPRTSPKPESEIVHVVRHVHLPPPPPIPQLKPEQITINLPPPDILSIVQNPSPLLPSQSRVIVTAKATVSDESGRPLNSSEIVTIPLLPTVPVSYDDYKEGDESFDPFYRDVPKIRNQRDLGSKVKKMSLVDEVGAAGSTRRSRRKRSTLKEDEEEYEDDEEPVYEADEEEEAEEDELSDDPEQIKDIEAIRANLKKFKAMLLGYNTSEENKDEGIVKLADEEPANDAEEETEAPQTEKSVEESQTPNPDEPEESKVAKSTESESESSADTRKSDRDEYIEFKSVMNTKGLSDAMEYVHDKNDSEAEEQVDSEVTKSMDEEETKSVEKMTESVSDAVDSNDGEKNSDARNDETSDPEEKNVEVESLEDNVAATTVQPEINSTEGTLLSNVTGSTENKSLETRTPEVGESVREDLATQETSSNFQGSAEFESTSAAIEPDEEDFSESNDAADTLDSGKATKDILSSTSVSKMAEVQPDEQDSPVKFEIPEAERTSGPEFNQTLGENTNGEVPELESRRELEEEITEGNDNVEASDKASGNSDKAEEKVDSASIEVTTIEAEAGVSSNEENKSSSISLSSEEEEQIDSQIFEEPDSRSSKEVGTRAIASHGSKSPKASSKNSMITKTEVEVEKTSETREDDASYSNDGTGEEDEEYIDNDDLSNESAYFSSLTSDEYPEEISSESPNRIPSADATISDDEIPRDSRIESSSTEYSASSSRESSNSQTSSDENLSSSNSPDYAESDYISDDSRTNEDVSRRSMEDSGTLEDTSSYSQDYSTISSNESNKDQSSSAKTSCEDDIDDAGVMKYTDEIPKGKKKHRKHANQNLGTNESQSSALDYIDDNYEPDHYAETNHLNSSNSEEPTRIHANSSMELNDQPLQDEPSKNQTNESTEKHEAMEFGKLEATEAPTSEAPSFTETPDEAVSTEIVPVEEVVTETVDSTTTTTTTTPTPPTTTTPKPTPPSLFRPFSMRKNFNYIPPTTTPNPVVIKHRFGLTNPKPAKPVKSYNEIAAKPVIRPHPLLTRKGYDPKSTSEKSKEPHPNAENSKRLIDPPTTRDSLDEESTTHTTLASSNVEVVSRNDAVDASTASTSTLLSVTPYPLLKATIVIGNNNLIPPPDDKLFDENQTTTTTSSSNVIPLVEDKLIGNDETTTVDLETTTPPGIASHEKPMERPHRDKLASFNCLDKDPYRFYADPRDCRLFHYCSPGFTTRQMLDFRFVCENTTVFDEKTQSCRSDLDETKCSNLKW